MTKDFKIDDFNEVLAGALSRAGRLEGVEADEEYGILIRGKHLDDYLAVCYLGQLFESGQAEIEIAPSKCEYIFKLLHIGEEKNESLESD